MNKKLIGFGLVGLIILGGIVFWASKSEKPSQNNPSTEDLVFFYGETCPHCKNVENFLEENKNIEEKVKFNKLEISNKDNAKILLEKAEKCGLSQENIGVPLFWDGSKCIVGDADIIDFLKSKAN